MLAVGNDTQFARFAAAADRGAWVTDERFATNPSRVANRSILVPLVAKAMRQQTTAWWVESLSKVEVPCGPVRDVSAIFADAQCAARDLKISIRDLSSESDSITLVGNPIKLSETPITYRVSPPRLGAHTVDVLTTELGLSSSEIAHLRSSGAIG